MTLPPPTFALLDAGSPGVDEARRAFEDELRHIEYHRTWWSLLRQWIIDRLAVPVGDTDLRPVLVPLLVAFVLALIAVAIWWYLRGRRPRPTPTSEPGAVFGEEGVLSATEYRTRARAHHRAGRWSEAVVDAFRAMAATAVDRGIVTDRPDLTAHEVGVGLAAAHPDQAEPVRDADRVFAVVLYGGGRARPEDAESLLALDATLLDADASQSSGPVASELPR